MHRVGEQDAVQWSGFLDGVEHATQLLGERLQIIPDGSSRSGEETVEEVHLPTVAAIVSK